MFSAAAVRRMLVPLKLALSKRTILVFSVISLFSPPMTPARPTGLCSSQMHSMFGVTLRSLPSRVRAGLALARGAHDDVAALHAGEVKGVHRPGRTPS